MKHMLFVVLMISMLFSFPACGISQAVAHDTGKKNSGVHSAVNSFSYDGVYPQHVAFGTGVGAMPGRVVWSHNPAAVEWDGSGYWWRENNFDESVIQGMLNSSIASLGGQDSTIAGWEALFRSHNATRAGRDVGYISGEKIAIKANMNGSGVFADDAAETHMGYANPVLLKTLLLSLVEHAGVGPSDITVYDVSRVFPDYMISLCSSGKLKGVRFEYRDVLGKNDASADRSAPVVWSQKFSGDTNFFPRCVTQARYVINFANLKGHSYGITLSAKNHFGSLMNSSRLRPPEVAGIHRFLTNNSMDSYTVLVDLLANYQLGEKTILYMLDALICAPSEGASISGKNSRWQQAPFNGNYTASVFVSQDPLALDSVGADFLMNEPSITERNSALRNNPNVENYLHEAGLVGDAPSGAVYYNGNGKKVQNIGVHEHWNNSSQKQYGRNLGETEGIELVYIGIDADAP